MPRSPARTASSNAIYRGKLYWFYGDTDRLSYALGNFAMSGATTELPEKIDPPSAST